MEQSKSRGNNNTLRVVSVSPLYIEVLLCWKLGGQGMHVLSFLMLAETIFWKPGKPNTVLY